VLIRPPRQRVMFTEVHGITWSMVARADAFVTVWQRLLPLLDGVSLLAAHNAPFDRKVLTACCQSAGVAMPIQPFICTVQIARRRWQQRGNSLPVVCQRLGISLTHHHAGSDAEACARIVIAACATETCPGNE